MNQRLHQLELRTSKAIEEKCDLCESPNHNVDIYPGLHSLKAVMQHPEEAVNWVSNSRPYGNNNNETNWQKNPNLGFGNQNQNQCQNQNQFQPEAELSK